jgi:flagellar assembly protein FliH
MSAVTRFTFDLDLAHTEDNAGFLGDAARAALEQEAYARGHAAGLATGERNATAAAAQALAAAASVLADRAAVLLGKSDAARLEAERSAVALAAGIARKLAAGLLTQQPTAELEALLVDCLTSLSAVPHLVIRCHPDIVSRLQEIAAARVAASGFSGRLIVMGEPEIALGDGRIEWAEGGLVRDSAAIWADIDICIAAYLAARGASHPEDSAP